MEHTEFEHLKSGEVNLGVRLSSRVPFSEITFFIKTSIMAVQFRDGVVIGADSRTTTGSYIVWNRFFFFLA
jgi:20S proteasome subunit beta 1